MAGYDRELDRGDQDEVVVAPDLPYDDADDTDEGSGGGNGGDRGLSLRGPGASVPKARAYSRYLPVGMCCQFVWNCIAAPHSFGLADANAAWARAAVRHTDAEPPPGAPVYWAGGSHGHIAISVGGGTVRSTDWPEKGKVGKVDIARITRAWRITYRGWSADWAGVPIPGIGGPSPVDDERHGLLARLDDEAVRPGARNDAVRRFNAALWRSMPSTYRAAHRAAWAGEAADLYGPVSQQVCLDKYVLLNAADPKRWPVPTTPVWPGPALLRLLGFAPD
ncbi:MAG: hypothetical protein JWP82_2864 [Humibacillus sp.]|nr:hypothetical protein [Humibacillus sp.]